MSNISFLSSPSHRARQQLCYKEEDKVYGEQHQ
jgi:hypothetical protein